MAPGFGTLTGLVAGAIWGLVWMIVIAVTFMLVSGAITVLYDGGYDANEILAFLFTPDDSLPGRPVDALHGQKAREVIRRAQAMAF